jgi:hypothetical protein
LQPWAFAQSRPIYGLRSLNGLYAALGLSGPTRRISDAGDDKLLELIKLKNRIRDVVHVYLVKASIGGYQYDELKWKRILFKRTLADCAIDGRLPEKNLVTPQQAAMEAVRWLERLERGEISNVIRRDLIVELTPVEIKRRVIKYGDSTKLNNKINNENSETIHNRMMKDPGEWEEYHRQYREARKTWPIVPYEEIIKRIKQLSPRLQIGDFACGEAKILEAFGQSRVFSFDHIAINSNVTACDIKDIESFNILELFVHRWEPVHNFFL